VYSVHFNSTSLLISGKLTIHLHSSMVVKTSFPVNWVQIRCGTSFQLALEEH